MNFRSIMKGHELETTTPNLEPTILEGVTCSALEVLSDDSIFSLKLSSGRATRYAEIWAEALILEHHQMANILAPTGQHSQDPQHLLQGQGVPQAHPAQGHPVQSWQGLPVRPG